MDTRVYVTWTRTNFSSRVINSIAFLVTPAVGDEVVGLVDTDRRGGNGESGTWGGSAGKNGGSDDVFDGLLDDAAHWAGTHFWIVTFFDQNLFGFVCDYYGDFLIAKGFVGRSNHEVEDL